MYAYLLHKVNSTRLIENPHSQIPDLTAQKERKEILLKAFFFTRPYPMHTFLATSTVSLGWMETNINCFSTCQKIYIPYKCKRKKCILLPISLCLRLHIEIPHSTHLHIRRLAAASCSMWHIVQIVNILDA